MIASQPSPTEASYELLQYDSLPLPQTHPDTLCAAARLLGMTPAPVDRCSVLELGCASGGNLLPMAAAYPASRFTGVDLAEGQVRAGQRVADTLGLTNVTLHKADLCDPDLPLTEYDYILCHGVYSWVSDAARARIWEICRRHLRPQGVAYISYNTYPGWYGRQMVRDMMRYHAARITDAQEAVEQGRTLLDFMIKNVPNQGGSYHAVLLDEQRALRDTPGSYIFHEHMEEHNTPCCFHEFAAAAGQAGLQYMIEAESRVCLAVMSPDAAEVLAPLQANIVRLEQYLDFLCNRSLRQSLLCHGEVPLERRIQPHRLRELGLHVSAFARPTGAQPPPFQGDVRESFRSKCNTVQIDDPITRAVLWSLHKAWPRALSVSELQRAVTELLADAPSWEAERRGAILDEVLLAAYHGSLIRIHASPSPCGPPEAAQAERPRASALARLQAQAPLREAGQTRVTNLCHHAMVISAIEWVLLPLLDGQRDRAALLDGLVRAAQDGTLEIKGHGGAMPEPKLREILAAQIGPALARLSQGALLV